MTKQSYKIKLTAVVLALCILPVTTAFACPCHPVEDEEQQVQQKE